MNIAERLKEIRKYYKLNQQEFANEIKMAKVSVAKWESGALMISESTALLISEKFNVNYDWLMFGKGEMFLNEKEQFVEILKKIQPNITNIEIDFLKHWFALPTGKREIALVVLKAMIVNLKDSVYEH